MTQPTRGTSRRSRSQMASVRSVYVLCSMSIQTKVPAAWARSSTRRVLATQTSSPRSSPIWVSLSEGVERLRCTPSLKLTQMGLDLGDEVCVANTRRVLERAHAAGTFVWIDMEQSTYTERTLAIW